MLIIGNKKPAVPDMVNDHDKVVTKLTKNSISSYGFKSSLWNGTPFLTPKELAQALGVSVKTLERMRIDGSGPPFIKIFNKRIRYPIVSLDVWIKQKETTQIELSNDGSTSPSPSIKGEGC